MGKKEETVHGFTCDLHMRSSRTGNVTITCAPLAQEIWPTNALLYRTGYGTITCAPLGPDMDPSHALLYRTGNVPIKCAPLGPAM